MEPELRRTWAMYLGRARGTGSPVNALRAISKRRTGNLELFQIQTRGNSPRSASSVLKGARGALERTVTAAVRPLESGMPHALPKTLGGIEGKTPTHDQPHQQAAN